MDERKITWRGFDLFSDEEIQRQADEGWGRWIEEDSIKRYTLSTPPEFYRGDPGDETQAPPAAPSMTADEFERAWGG